MGSTGRPVSMLERLPAQMASQSKSRSSGASSLAAEVLPTDKPTNFSGQPDQTMAQWEHLATFRQNKLRIRSAQCSGRIEIYTVRNFVFQTIFRPSTT